MYLKLDRVYPTMIKISVSNLLNMYSIIMDNLTLIVEGNEYFECEGYSSKWTNIVLIIFSFFSRANIPNF